MPSAHPCLGWREQPALRGTVGPARDPAGCSGNAAATLPGARRWARVGGGVTLKKAELIARLRAAVPTPAPATSTSLELEGVQARLEGLLLRIERHLAVE